MEFRVAKSDFTRALSLAGKVSDAKSTMPMLGHVLLRVTDPNTLTVAATDLNQSLMVTLPITGGKVGAMTILTKKLSELVAPLASAEVTFRKIEANWAEVKGGKTTYKIVGTAGTDFPKIPSVDGALFAEINADTFREMIDKTLFAVCHDETRFHLNGILFESTGTVTRMVSTDGHRLAKVERTLENAPTLSHGVIIPKAGAATIKRAIEGASACRIVFKGPYVFVAVDGVVLAVKLIDSQFPPYDAVIPKEHKLAFEVDRLTMLDAVKRTQVMSSEARGLKMVFAANGITLSSDSPDAGDVTETVDATSVGANGTLTIGFNPKYLADIVTHIATERIVFEVGGELDPGIVRPADANDRYLGVIMPMRI